MDILLSTNINSKTLQIEDAQSAVSFKKMASPNFRYMMHKLAGASSEDYSDMEYDLSESARILDTESIVAAIMKKKRQLILKNGWKITSNNSKNLEYIKQRLAEFEFVTSLSFREFLSEVIENMVNFNNCFILKLRKEDNSSGQIRTLPDGKEFKPISGLYVLAAPTIDTATNSKSGRVIRYRHRVTEEFSKQFRPEDIFHIYENKRSGITIGTPPLEAVKDDIILLRSVEQDASQLIHRHSNPFIHVQVGTDKQPARLLGDGSSEIDIYADIVQQMPEEGGVATPHRVKVNMLGAESHALRLETYLEYFKKRVYAGLGVSENDLGGSSGSSGSSSIASQALKEDVRSYQDVIGNFFTDYLFNELLLEAPFNAKSFTIAEEDKVYLTFLESDIDKKIKLESHYLNLYISGLINKEAAIKYSNLHESDIQLDSDSSNSNLNSVKNNIKNNQLDNKNQHNIQDSLTNMEYYNDNYKIFLNNIIKTFSLEFLKRNRKEIKAIYRQSRNNIKDVGEKTVNQIIEDYIFNLLILT